MNSATASVTSGPTESPSEKSRDKDTEKPSSVPLSRSRAASSPTRKPSAGNTKKFELNTFLSQLQESGENVYVHSPVPPSTLPKDRSELDLSSLVVGGLGSARSRKSSSNVTKRLSLQITTSSDYASSNTPTLSSGSNPFQQQQQHSHQQKSEIDLGMVEINSGNGRVVYTKNVLTSGTSVATGSSSTGFRISRKDSKSRKPSYDLVQATDLLSISNSATPNSGSANNLNTHDPLLKRNGERHNELKKKSDQLFKELENYEKELKRYSDELHKQASPSSDGVVAVDSPVSSAMSRTMSSRSRQGSRSSSKVYTSTGGLERREPPIQKIVEEPEQDQPKPVSIMAQVPTPIEVKARPRKASERVYSIPTTSASTTTTPTSCPCRIIFGADNTSSTDSISRACPLCEKPLNTLVKLYDENLRYLEEMQQIKEQLDEEESKVTRQVEHIVMLKSKILELEESILEKTDEIDAARNDLEIMSNKLVEEVSKREEVEQQKTAIQEELEQLTQSLFEEANGMVAEEARRRFMMEKEWRDMTNKYVETKARLAEEQEQLQELKTKMEELVNEKEMLMMRLMEQSDGMGGVMNDELMENELVEAISLGAFPVDEAGFEMANIHQGRNMDDGEFLDIIQLKMFEEFIVQASEAKMNKLHNIPFLKLCLEDDVQPCLKFGWIGPGRSKFTVKMLVESIVNNELFVEEIKSRDIASGMFPPTNGFVSPMPSPTKQHNPHNPSNEDSPIVSPTSNHYHPESTPPRPTSAKSTHPPNVSSSPRKSSSTSAPCSTCNRSSRPCYIKFRIPASTTSALDRYFSSNSDSNFDTNTTSAPSSSPRRISLGGANSQSWHPICLRCRDRLVTCCEFYALIRQIKLGLHHRRTIRELFLEVCHIRKKMFLTRWGGPTPVWTESTAEAVVRRRSFGVNGNGNGNTSVDNSMSGIKGPSPLMPSLSLSSLTAGADDFLEHVKNLPITSMLREKLLGGTKAGEIQQSNSGSNSPTRRQMDDVEGNGDVSHSRGNSNASSPTKRKPDSPTSANISVGTSGWNFFKGMQ